MLFKSCEKAQISLNPRERRSMSRMTEGWVMIFLNWTIYVSLVRGKKGSQMQSLAVLRLMTSVFDSQIKSRFHKTRANRRWFCFRWNKQRGWDIFICFSSADRKKDDRVVIHSHTNYHFGTVYPQRWFYLHFSAEVLLVKLLCITMMLILETWPWVSIWSKLKSKSNNAVF